MELTDALSSDLQLAGKIRLFTGLPAMHRPMAPSFCSSQVSRRSAMPRPYVNRLDVELRIVLDVTLVRPRLTLKVS